MTAGAFGERVGHRPGHRFGEPQRIGVGGMLGIEAFERELGEDDELRALRGGLVDRLEPAADVVGLVGSGVLLNQRDFHAPILSRQAASHRRANVRASAMNTAARTASTSTCGQSCHTAAFRQNTFK